MSRAGPWAVRKDVLLGFGRGPGKVPGQELEAYSQRQPFLLCDLRPVSYPF